jgi:hypothetical protein
LLLVVVFIFLYNPLPTAEVSLNSPALVDKRMSFIVVGLLLSQGDILFGFLYGNVLLL